MNALNAVLLGSGLVAVLAVSAWLSVIDLREHRLPNRIVGPLAGAVAVWLVALGVVTGDLGRTAAALGWGCAAFGVFLLLNLTVGLGMGDVKYAWPVAATLGWFGWPALKVGIYGLIVSGGIVAVVLLARGRSKDTRVAYGPYMAFGLLCGLAQALI